MRYNRFAKIPGILTTPVSKEYELPKVSQPDVRIVDDSKYQPNKKALEILAKNKALGMLTDMVYDNPDDIKSGAVNVYARQKGRDMAELTQQMRRLQKEASDIIERNVVENSKPQSPQPVAPATAPSDSSST